MFEKNSFSLNVRSDAMGRIILPGSKSISNRVILLAAFGDKNLQITNFLESEDTEVMLSVLNVLGINYEKKIDIRKNISTLSIEGVGNRLSSLFNKPKKLKFFVGNSGLTIRTILPFLVAFFNSKSKCLGIEIDGVERMRQRPISALVDCLNSIGGNITYLDSEGSVPILIKPSKIIHKEEVVISVKDSSQFLTGMLQAAPFLRDIRKNHFIIKTIGNISSRPYIELTINILKKFNVFVDEIDKGIFKVNSNKLSSPDKIEVEGDASSASYFLAAGVLGKGPICIEGVGSKSMQGDIKLANFLEKMGAEVIFTDYSIKIKAKNKLKGISVDCSEIPDAAMVLVPCALYAEGPTLLTNIGSWRVKETDRIEAMIDGIVQLGGMVTNGHDWIKVFPSERLSRAQIKTFNDHRVAMSFSLASFSHSGDEGNNLREVFFDKPSCVDKTYPEFFNELARICSESVPVITIDGPTASGKGTIAKKISEALGFNLLDSGCFYRALALVSSELSIADNDEENLKKCAENLKIRFFDNKVLFGDNDITDKIRQEFVGIRASKISVFQSVRDTLLRTQRDFARQPGLVADGRDMGSIVFPKAILKVFLSADAQIRARRRYNQLIQKEIPCKISVLLKEIETRDQRDFDREAGSLKLAKEACTIYIDSTAKTVDEVVGIIIDEFNKKSTSCD